MSEKPVTVLASNAIFAKTVFAPTSTDQTRVSVDTNTNFGPRVSDSGQYLAPENSSSEERERPIG